MTGPELRALLDVQARPAAKLVLLAVALRAGSDGRAWPSVARICADTGLSARGVRYALRALAAAGHLDAEHRPGRSLLVTVTAAPLAGVPRHLLPVPWHESTESAALGAPRSKKNYKRKCRRPARPQAAGRRRTGKSTTTAPLPASRGGSSGSGAGGEIQPGEDGRPSAVVPREGRCGHRRAARGPSQSRRPVPALRARTHEPRICSAGRRPGMLGQGPRRRRRTTPSRRRPEKWMSSSPPGNIPSTSRGWSLDAGRLAA